jgi:hypothetical protein
MSRADLTALIARVEAATGPDRELDAEITWAAYPELALKWRDKTEAFYTPQGQRVRVLPYTSSIDAAASLVPKWFGYLVGVDDDTPVASVFPPHADRHWVAASNPALALTAAALRARLAQMEDSR